MNNTTQTPLPLSLFPPPLQPSTPPNFDNKT